MSSYKLSWNNHEVIKVLTRNAIKCLVCNTVLESKHQYHFLECGCVEYFSGLLNENGL